MINNYSFEIVTDSSANLPDDIVEKYSLHVLSLTVRADEQEYRCFENGKQTDFEAFYKMMREGKSLSTSQINPEECEQLFEALANEGKNVLYIGFSSALSGTYQLATLTAERVLEDYPDSRILTVDSLSASAGEGLLVMLAALLREQGASLDEVYQKTMDTRLKICHRFTVDDLTYLKRGGRISPTTAVFAAALNIKPLMRMDDEGRLVSAGKIRGRKPALAALADNMREAIENPEGQTVFIVHADCEQDAAFLAQRIGQDFPQLAQVRILPLDPVIGCHSGPGTVSVFFIGGHR